MNVFELKEHIETTWQQAGKATSPSVRYVNKEEDKVAMISRRYIKIYSNRVYHGKSWMPNNYKDVDIKFIPTFN